MRLLALLFMGSDPGGGNGGSTGAPACARFCYTRRNRERSLPPTARPRRPYGAVGAGFGVPARGPKFATR
jgi:hypothetical protein